MPRVSRRTGLALSGAALVAALVVAALAHGGSKADSQMVFAGRATPIGEFWVRLAPGESVTFETVNLSPNSDPVLHLLNRTGVQVALDDNRGAGNAARLSYRSPDGGDYLLVLRSRTPSSYGSADIRRNGSSWQTHVRFGGWQVELDGLRDRESVEAVRLPRAAGPVLLLYLLKENDLGIARRALGGGVAASIYLATGPGTRRVLVGVTGRNARIGPVRLVRNDRGIFNHDSDVDGLGNELEATLQTCASATSVVRAVSCRALADPRDTDGDGLSDGAETLGRRVGNENLALPLWGADARHKDLFIEVDFMRVSKEENTQKTDETMSAGMARAFAAAYGDTTRLPSVRARHAAMLRNPDGRAGIAVHLDTGRATRAPRDTTIFGDWGGHSAVDAIKKDDEWKGVDYWDAWKEEMSERRRGFFHHAMAFASGGSQTGPGFAAAYSLDSASIAAHETGHSFGLGHSGPYGLEVDVNCKPNYPSLMNYAYDDTLMFADGTSSNGPSLNNAKLQEAFGVSPRRTAFLERLEDVFGYYVDKEHGHVDWNRDGRFGSPNYPVRAYANYRPGGTGCEFTRWNKTRVSSAKSAVAPALARLDGRLRVFFVDDDGALWYSTAYGTWSCPKPAVRGCGGASWGSPSHLRDHEVAGVDAVRLGDQEALLVVASDIHGGLWERLMRPKDSGSWQRIPGPVAAGPPSLARVGDDTMLAYRDNRRYYRYRIRSAGGRWQGSFPFWSAGGDLLRAKGSSTFSPAVIEAPLRWAGHSRGLFALLADEEEDRLDLWYWDPSSGRFEKTNLVEPVGDKQPGPASGRPALAATRNRLYVVYRKRDSHEAKLMFSYTNVAATGSRLRVGLLGELDNAWATIQGADVLYEPGTDTNLRAVLTHGKERASKYELWFYPKADGIQDYRYRPYNDWEVLRVNLCREVVDPGGTVSNPIKCPSKTW